MCSCLTTDRLDCVQLEIFAEAYEQRKQQLPYFLWRDASVSTCVAALKPCLLAGMLCIQPCTLCCGLDGTPRPL